MKKLMSRGLHDDVLAMAQELLAPMSSDFPVPMYAQLHARCSLHLRLLEAYLVKAASKGHGRPVVDIYQRVQCCSGLLPRLYLLVTLGSVCIKMRAVKPKLILQDVAEMCHAVHHPVRGLFLRAFMTQMFRDKMPAATDAIPILLINFQETNKLWLRLHAETPEADKEEQAAELHQMLEVVTVNLRTLRALRGMDVETYRKAVLPFVQEQVVNARDPVLQETLYSAFVRVFADRHLATLPEAIQALDWLHPDTKAEVILRVLMDVISESVTRSAQVVPASNDWFLMFTEQVEAVATRRSLGSDEKLLNSASLIRMSVACFPTEQKYVEQAIADGIRGLEQDGDSTLKHSEQVVALISAAVSGRGAVEILGLESVTTLNDQLLPAAQAEVAAALCRGLISSDTPLDSPQVVEQVFRYLQPLIASETDDDSAEGGAEKLLSESEIRGQQLLAALITQLRSDDPDVLFKLYVGTRKMFMRGGPARIKYTMPALVTGGVQLAATLTALPANQMLGQTSPKKVWGFCHQTCSELKKQGHQALALRLFLTCAQRAAAAPGLESVSSEFVSQALTILQEPTRAWSLSAAYAASPEAERTEALILCCGVVQTLTSADGDQSNGLKPEHAESAIATCTTVAREIGNHKSLISCAYLHAADEARQQTGVELLEAALSNEDGMDVMRTLDVLNALIYFAERGSAEALEKCGALLPQIQSVEANGNASPVRPHPSVRIPNATHALCHAHAGTKLTAFADCPGGCRILEVDCRAHEGKPSIHQSG